MQSSIIKWLKGSIEELFELFFYIFFYALFLISTSEILWKLTVYVLYHADKIIGTTSLSFGDTLNSIIDYVMNFDPYNKTLYTMLVGACIFALYLILSTFIYLNIIGKGKRYNRKEIKKLGTFISLFLILDLIICTLFISAGKNIVTGVVFCFIYVFALYLYNIFKIDYKKSRNYLYFALTALSVILLLMLLALSSFLLLEKNFDEKLEYFLSSLVFLILAYYLVFKLIEEIRASGKFVKIIIDYMKNHRLSVGVVIYLLFLYLVLILLFAKMKIPEIENKEGVLILLGTALLVSGGFSVCGFVISRAIKRNREVLGLLGIRIGVEIKGIGEEIGEIGEEIGEIGEEIEKIRKEAKRETKRKIEEILKKFEEIRKEVGKELEKIGKELEEVEEKLEEKLEETAKELEEKLEETAKELEEIEEEAEKIKKNRAKLEEIRSKFEEIEDETEKTEIIKKEHEKAKEKLEEIEKKYGEIRVEFEKLKLELKETRDKLKEISDKLERIGEKTSEIRIIREKFEKKIQEIKEEFKRIEKDLEAEFKEKIREKTREFEEKFEELREIEERLEDKFEKRKLEDETAEIVKRIKKIEKNLGRVSEKENEKEFRKEKMMEEIERVEEKIREIIERIKEKRKELIRELRDHINSFLVNFPAAISGYILLHAILPDVLEKLRSSGSSENPLEFLLATLTTIEENLSVILFIPLYILFFKICSTLLRNIYKKVYIYIEKVSSVSPDEIRRESVVNLFDRLTRLVIIVGIIFHFFDRIGLYDKMILKISPVGDILKIAVAIPLALWILVIILDPFFENETIEVGSDKGKVKKVGLLFTKIETMTGEKVYLPNAELLARTIRRHNVRGKSSQQKGKEKGEEWIVIHFLCTLDYEHSIDTIENIFEGLFKEEERSNLENRLREIGYEKALQDVRYIFDERTSPFVSIEDFKDHGIFYKFNFRMRNSLYAPLFRSYFMKRFKEEMGKAKKQIATPLKFEITDIKDSNVYRRDKAENSPNHQEPA